MIAWLVLLPAVAALAALLLRRADGARRTLLVATAAAHAAGTALAWRRPPVPGLGGWLALDEAGLLFLTTTSVLFLAAAIYAVGYFRRDVREGGAPRAHADIEEGFLFEDAPEATFTACLLFFLASMTLVTMSQHFGLLWVGIEATTLASAPLIFHHRHHRSLEATWKYLLICSVGIAIALLGNFFLALAAPLRAGRAVPLLVSDLIQAAPGLNIPWLKAAFLLLLVGYGTKMGLAPLHTWLPDAHSEAPSLVSALLSGALLNCAFLGIVRAEMVMAAAGEGAFAQNLLVAFGLFSMAVAAVFIVGQRDFKRMLAYSSVEHMGIISLGVGLGGVAAFGAMLHAVNHSLAKAMLFLVSGNILGAYRTKSTREVSGMLKVIPASGVLWVVGFFAIAGAPPFGLFLSEFTILKGALDQGRNWIAFAYLALLGLIFAGMAAAMLRMAQGEAPDSEARIQRRPEPITAILPPAALALGVLGLGLYLPPLLRYVLQGAAHAVGQF